MFQLKFLHLLHWAAMEWNIFIHLAVMCEQSVNIHSSILVLTLILFSTMNSHFSSLCTTGGTLFRCYQYVPLSP